MLRTNIQRKIKSLPALIDKADENLLSQIESNIDAICDVVLIEYFQRKLLSEEWPPAADPDLICKDEDDKKIRASTMFSMFLASHLFDGCKPIEEKKVLDFGCGEGFLLEELSIAGCKGIGYDIVPNPNVITNFDEVIDNGPYDIVFLYDVLDHAINETPVEILEKAKKVLLKDGKIIVRCHPWCGRYGTHMWQLNKAFAHLVFTDQELERMGYQGIHTLKITNPDITYYEWFNEAKLQITWQKTTSEQAGFMFENNKELKERVLFHYGDDKIKYNLIEQLWRDFWLIPKEETVS